MHNGKTFQNLYLILLFFATYLLHNYMLDNPSSDVPKVPPVLSLPSLGGPDHQDPPQRSATHGRTLAVVCACAGNLYLSMSAWPFCWLHFGWALIFLGFSVLFCTHTGLVLYLKVSWVYLPVQEIYFSYQLYNYDSYHVIPSLIFCSVSYTFRRRCH